MSVGTTRRPTGRVGSNQYATRAVSGNSSSRVAIVGGDVVAAVSKTNSLADQAEMAAVEQWNSGDLDRWERLELFCVSPAVRRRAADNYEIRGDELAVIASIAADPPGGTPERVTARKLLKNPNLPVVAIERLAEVFAGRTEVGLVLTHPNCPPAVLERAADGGWSQGVFMAAGHPRTPPVALARLATDPGVQRGVRDKAAANPSCPPEAAAAAAFMPTGPG